MAFLDWYQLVHHLYIKQWHLTTVAQIIPVYAPASDQNDVHGYIQAVEQAMDIWRSGKILVRGRTRLYIGKQFFHTQIRLYRNTSLILLGWS